MHTIQQIPLLPGVHETELPEGAFVFAIGEDAGSLVLFAQVDPEARTITRRYAAVRTREELPSDAQTTPLWSYLLGDEWWHVLEVF